MRDIRPRNAAFGAPRHVLASSGGRLPPVTSGPFIGQFAARAWRHSDLPWKPSLEADVDVNNTLEPAITHRSTPASDEADLPCDARW